jgi:D-alanyl-lipoteichoic acid acyltransferase DltB (MBOAT superfamily)
MQIASLSFLLGLALLAALQACVPGRRGRSALLLLASAGFAALQFRSGLAWAAVAAFTLSGYGAAALLRRRPSNLGLGLYLLTLVLAFVYLKDYDGVARLVGPARSFPVELMGLSYMLFKQIHTAVDCAQGQVTRLSLPGYLLYQFNFLTLMAGPIQRYQDFMQQLDDPALPAHASEARAHWHRVLSGVLQILLSSFVLAFTERRLAYIQDVSHPALILKEFALIFYSYPLYVYLNFSGYCDAVIGAGRLLGFTLPENFDRPFLARNMLDFWNRWHITLSHWIRDYVFTPAYRHLVSVRPRYAKEAGYACLFMALLAAGVWHGASATFLIFGLIHGVGVSVNRMTEDAIVARYKRAGLRAYLGLRWVRVLAGVITMHYVGLSFLFFRPDIHQNIMVLRKALGALPW